MQGSIFTVFSEMVIEKLGIETWNELLDTVKPKSEGIYTKGMYYEDSEMMALVGALSKKTNIDVPTLVRTFGSYLFIHLFNSSPAKLSHIDNLKDFLRSIDSVIHKEVKRVYPQAYLPSFNYSETPEGDLVMIYHSKRKLCHLSEGLILSAASHFDEEVTITQPECMHNGAEKCTLLISFKDKK
ncbi:MAG: heme NO-binding domain-containing protein [Colwellia sp.]|nr:heme NO-binding domain-containing protein [Colwellia sp.]